MEKGDLKRKSLDFLVKSVKYVIWQSSGSDISWSFTDDGPKLLGKFQIGLTFREIWISVSNSMQILQDKTTETCKDMKKREKRGKGLK